MTTEDILTSIDATLTGYYETDVDVSGDAMRWAPTAPPERVHKGLPIGGATRLDDGWVVRFGCSCGFTTRAVNASEDVAEEAARAALYLHMGRSPVGDERAYVGNDTSREQEGQ